jgi:four helix bundle protein
MKDIRERAFEFAVRIVKLCQFLDQKPGVGRIMGNQLIRSGTSIGANLEEAQAGQSKADFIHKNAIALKEARETHSWLRLLSATEILPKNRIGSLQIEAEEIMNIIGAIITNSRKREDLRQKVNPVASFFPFTFSFFTSPLFPFAFLLFTYLISPSYDSRSHSCSPISQGL